MNIEEECKLKGLSQQGVQIYSKYSERHSNICSRKEHSEDEFVKGKGRTEGTAGKLVHYSSHHLSPGEDVSNVVGEKRMDSGPVLDAELMGLAGELDRIGISKKREREDGRFLGF